MKPDIVERLRNYDTCSDDDIDEAADEIERLRDELEDLRKIVYGGNPRIRQDLDSPRKLSRGWYVTRGSGVFYLRKDGTWQNGVGDGFWPTEDEAKAALAEFERKNGSKA